MVHGSGDMNAGTQNGPCGVILPPEATQVATSAGISQPNPQATPIVVQQSAPATGPA